MLACSVALGVGAKRASAPQHPLEHIGNGDAALHVIVVHEPHD